MNPDLRKGLVLVVASALVGALVLGIGFDDTTPSGSADQSNADSDDAATNEPTPTATPVVNTIPNASVDVLVANATDTGGFAGSISTQLTSLGYRPRDPTNADQTPPDGNSDVFYAPGFEAPALDIASALGLSATQVAALPVVSPVSVDLTGVDVIVVLDVDLVVAG